MYKRQVVEPKHYVQMMIGMGLGKLTRALYLVVCKETDLMDVERIHFVKERFDDFMERAKRIITSPEPLTRVSSDPFTPPCGFCEFQSICQPDATIDGGQLPDVNCRTCAHSTPIVDESEEAAWRCELTGEILSLQAQERGCDEHLYIPALVPYAEPIDGDMSFVLYQIRGKNQQFANVGATGFPAMDVPHFSSRSLREVPKEAIGNEVVEAVRDELGVLR